MSEKKFVEEEKNYCPECGSEDIAVDQMSSDPLDFYCPKCTLSCLADEVFHERPIITGCNACSCYYLNWGVEVAEEMKDAGCECTHEMAWVENDEDCFCFQRDPKFENAKPEPDVKPKEKATAGCDVCARYYKNWTKEFKKSLFDDTLACAYGLPRTENADCSCFLEIVVPEDGDVIEMVEIKSLKKGEYFKKKGAAKRVFIKGAYDRVNGGYECTAFDDISVCIYVKSNKKVAIGFTF